jgi:hypothetical protein
MLAKYKTLMPNQNATGAEIKGFVAYFKWADANLQPSTWCTDDVVDRRKGQVLVIQVTVKHSNRPSVPRLEKLVGRGEAAALQTGCEFRFAAWSTSGVTDRALFWG